MARSCSICTARVPVVALAILHVRVHLLPETYEFSRDLAQVPDKQGDHAVLLASGEPFEVFTQLKVSHNTKFKLRAHKDCPLREVAHPMFARVACEDYAKTFLSCFTSLGNVHIFLVPGLGTQIFYFCIWKDISNINSCVFKHQRQVFH